MSDATITVRRVACTDHAGIAGTRPDLPAGVNYSKTAETPTTFTVHISAADAEREDVRAKIINP